MEDGLWVQAGRSHPGHDADLPPGLEFVSGDRVQLVDLKVYFVVEPHQVQIMVPVAL